MESLRDQAIQEWLTYQKEIVRCSLCREDINLEAKKRAVKKGPLCNACKRAKSNFAKAERDLNALPPNSAEFDKGRLRRELDSRKFVLELREGDGAQFDLILNGDCSSTVDLEQYFEQIGRCIGHKEDLYGRIATQLGHWFSEPQMRLLGFLFWQAFHANPHNMNVITARRRRNQDQHIHSEVEV